MLLRYLDFTSKQKHIAVIGLGYVGLPLAVALAKHFSVLGYDASKERVAMLQQGIDLTREIEESALKESSLQYTQDPEDLRKASLFIVAVPTPIDGVRRPDLSALLSASALVGKYMSKGSLVVYESTVYPGVTEGECASVLEQESGLVCGQDFHLGYSPERINPGDKVHTVDKIVKVVSASCDWALELVSQVYGAVTQAGVFKASSIKVAEAAKVIENTQRDLNIALMNELALIFDKLDINTLDVLEAAGTKWNFLPFRPGLVGGHCIGVDPYYLTYKAESVGYHPQVILAGRRINDGMGKFIAEKTVKLLIHSGLYSNKARIGIFGFAFKENVPDLRNSRVIDIHNELQSFGLDISIHDPLVQEEEAEKEYGIALLKEEEMGDLDAIIVAVAHEEFKSKSLASFQKYCRKDKQIVFIDVKGLWSHEAKPDFFSYWCL